MNDTEGFKQKQKFAEAEVMTLFECLSSHMPQQQPPHVSAPLPHASLPSCPRDSPQLAALIADGPRFRLDAFLSAVDRLTELMEALRAAVAKEAKVSGEERKGIAT